MHSIFDAFIRRRWLLLASACAMAVNVPVQARPLVPDKPSVEVNLQALQELQRSVILAPPAPSMPPIYYAPALITQPAPIAPPAASPAPMQRQIPAEQPMVPGMTATRAPAPTAKPVAKKPALKPAPIPVIAQPIEAPKPVTVETPKPVEVPKPIVAPKPIEAPKAAPPLPPGAAPSLPPLDRGLIAKEKTTAAPQPALPPLRSTELPKPAPAVTLPPAPVPAPPPAPKPAPTPKPAPKVEPVKPAPPKVTAPPAMQLPPPPPLMVPTKPSAAGGAPSPDISRLDFSKLPTATTAPVAPAAPAAKITPPSATLQPAVRKEIAPAAAPKKQTTPPPLPELAPVVPAKPMAALPPSVASPLMVPVPKPPPSLPPSVTQRLTAPAPAKQGIVSDTTTIREPTPQQQAEWKAQEEARIKVQADTVKAKAAQAAAKTDVQRTTEAARLKAEIDAQKKADAQAKQKLQDEIAAAKLKEKLPAPPDALSKPKTPVTLEKTQIATLPALDRGIVSSTKPIAPAAPALPKAPSAAAPALPTLPDLTPPAAAPPSNLPSLNAITGNDRPSSMDILQPKDAVDSKPLPSVTGKASGLPALPKDDNLPTVRRALPEVKVAPKPPAPPVKAETRAETITAIPSVKEVTALPPPELPPAAPAAKTETSVQVAVATPPPSSKSTGSLETRITFASDKADLSSEAKDELSDIADKVKKSQSSIRVVGYAAGTAEQASVARRLSNSRALQIRAFLLSKGVSPLNINVQALGNVENADRADIFIK